MRKVYHPNTQAAEKCFWETYWMQESLEDAIRYCDIDYLRPVFLEYLPPSGPILEGGCGLGQYVIYYRNLGYEIYGLDWVGSSLERIRKHHASASVLNGDVCQLPFKSKSFKAYYSGGVVEHFEDGPHRALEETYRVLDDDGILIITVPFMNSMRRLKDYLYLMTRRRSLRAGKSVNEVDVVYKLRQEAPKEDESQLDGCHFHEYMFTRREFTRLLKQAGFRVIQAHGVAVQWGLLELPWMRGLYARFRGDGHAGDESLAAPQGTSNRRGQRTSTRSRARQLLKDLIISESSDGLISRPLLWLLRNLAGHLALFVCEKVS